MGTLVAMHYPTDLVDGLADHTYVKCGSGSVAWKCWGGDQNGQELGRAQGSTARADAIAQPDQKAGICCYLVNGVCHQAANRILLPAMITVSKARGYSVSQAMFGSYGRVGFWPCHAPLEEHKDVSGDLAGQAVALGVDMMVREDSQKLDYQFLRRELDIYRRAAPTLRNGIQPQASLDAGDVHVALFLNMAEFHLGPAFEGLSDDLKQVRTKTEELRRAPEVAYQNREMNASEFARHFNDITHSFQEEMADTLHPADYKTLFALEPDERVILADPRIVEQLEPV